jgi:4-hydroxy-tetrahydrodipicolinate reductase
MIRVLVNGCFGRMGSEVVSAVSTAEDMQLVAGVDAKAGQKHALLDADGNKLAPVFDDLADAIAKVTPDVMVDFTHPSAVAGNLEVALVRGVDCVVGTTGLTTERLTDLAARATSGTTLFYAPNFTTGAVLMMQFARMAARYFPDCDVIEFHHDGKADAPSGTAVRTAQIIAEARQSASPAPGRETEIAGCEGARGALVDGVYVHSIRNAGYVAHQEVIFGSAGQTLTIRHDSIDRSSYMPGVLLAIRGVGDREGLIIGLEHLMEG